MYYSELEAIPILAAKIVFTFQTTFDKNKDLVGYLKFDGITIDKEGFEIVFANKQDRIVIVLAVDQDDKCWKISILIICQDAVDIGLNQLLDSGTERECMVYKVHKSTLELVLARGMGLATYMVKDLIRYYKVLHVQMNHVCAKPQYTTHGAVQELT